MTKKNEELVFYLIEKQKYSIHNSKIYIAKQTEKIIKETCIKSTCRGAHIPSDKNIGVMFLSGATWDTM